jgi:nucleoside-diphosphate-sugar epimerase
MTWMVTGGTGFIGSRVVRDLVKRGDKVTVYDWCPDRGMLEHFLSQGEIEENVKIVQGDVSDFAHLVATLQQFRTERIVHTAALLLHDVNSQPLQGVRTNCEGTVAVFESARLLGLKKVVWISSGSVYGPPEAYAEEYIPNDAPHFPQNLYGATKSMDEQFAVYYSDKYGLDVAAIRLVLVYGAWQSRGRTAAIIRETVVNPALGKPGRVPAARENILGWTYVDDAARAITTLADSPKTRTRSFSICGDIRTVGQMADYVQKLLPGADISFLALEKSQSHLIMTCKYDMSRIEEEIGFHTRWGMEDGVRETINALRRERGLAPVG